MTDVTRNDKGDTSAWLLNTLVIASRMAKQSSQLMVIALLFLDCRMTDVTRNDKGVTVPQTRHFVPVVIASRMAKQSSQ